MKGKDGIKTWVTVDSRRQSDYACYMPDGYYWEVIQGAPMGCYPVRQGRVNTRGGAYDNAFMEQARYCEEVQISN